MKTIILTLALLIGYIIIPHNKSFSDIPLMRVYSINDVSNMQNKKFYLNYHRRVKWTKSFIVSTVEKNAYNTTINVYNHNSSLYKIYDIASITKTFTSLTILQLHEEEKLNIDDSVSLYISYYDDKVTIRNLITHSSGSHNGINFSYSNLNYTLLKQIIEKVTGKPYAYELQTRFFIPMEMFCTTAIYSNGAGSILSCVNDLQNYATMLLNKGIYKDKEILSETIYNEMFNPSKENNNDTWFFNSGGFETFCDDNGKVKSFYKSGRWYTSVSGIEIFPDQNKALIYIGEPYNCLSISVATWRNSLWRFLRKNI